MNQALGTKPAWFEALDKAKVTGSTIDKALGLDGLVKEKQRFDHVICCVPENQVSSAVEKLMKYGEKNEYNAAATLVG
jgi:hypothetical protein